MTHLLNKGISIPPIVRYHLPALLYAAGIIALSSCSNITVPSIAIPALDKVAHFMEYGLFALLIFRSVSHFGSNRSLRSTMIVSALFLIFFALLDETYQHFIPNRQSDIMDFFADLSASAIVLAFIGWYRYRFGREHS